MTSAECTSNRKTRRCAKRARTRAIRGARSAEAPARWQMTDAVKRGRKPADLTGLRFGLLLVIKRATGPGKDAYWECACDCGGRRVARGYLLKTGRTKCCGCSVRSGNQHTPLELRFWRSVDVRKPDECWPWIGRLTKGRGQGYGQLNVDGKPTGAHRVSWELSHGRPLGDLHIDHICMNKRCVNPAHLDACTPQENTARWGASIVACPSGHAYTDENTRTDVRGKRHCRACERSRFAGPTEEP